MSALGDAVRAPIDQAAVPTNKMSAVPFSIFRAWLIASNTLREAVRQRLFVFIALLAFALTLGAQWLRDFNFGSSELKFVADFGFGAMAFFGAALAIAATAQLFFSEIDHRTALTLLAKPVWRAEFLVGKFLGVAMITAGFCGLLTGLLATVLWARELALMRSSPGAFDHGFTLGYAAIAGAGFAQWLKLVVLSALTLLVASFARTQLFTTVSGFLILVICHLQFLMQEAAARSGSAITHGLAGWLSLLLPNFQIFDFSSGIGLGDGFVWSDLARVTLYSLGYVTAVCALTCVSFRGREI
jgi:ABC-type transport system involved in multi-copper enzyme maturation permease subunit